MLWQKESKQDNALYEDITSGLNLTSEFRKMMSNTSQSNEGKKTKKHEISLFYRKAGNSEFACDNWMVSIECYNQSLLFAENGSEDISLAYGNRSASFFYAKMYQKCLDDIQLAIDANYPMKLLPKLEKRKAECSKLINTDQSQSRKPKLSFEQDTHFPCLGSALEIAYNKEFGRHFVAKCDINVGQTILVDEMYVMGVLRENTMKCSICFKEEVNLIPCNKCTNALFCSKECQDNGIHEVECNSQIMCEEQFDPTVFSVFRSVLVAINKFRDVDQLMCFVEKYASNEGNEIPESFPDFKSKYKAFLQLSMDKYLKNCKNNGSIHVVFKILLQNAEIKKMFQTINRRRFLMHLIGHHLSVFEHNRKATSSFEQGANYYLCILASYFNHSCAPNVIFTDKNNFCVCKAVRPITKGEQLFVYYYQHEIFDTPNPFEPRQSHLLKQFGFKCKCEQCTHRQAPRKDRKTMDADPMWKFLQNQNSFELILSINTPATQNINETCEKFLQKYGRTVWCYEICWVVGLYAGGL